MWSSPSRARDEKETVGEGVHERVVVNVARFDQRLAEKVAMIRR